MVAMFDLTLRKVTEDYEIIVVDDGSTDHSREILQSLTSLYPRLRLIFHERNRGYGAALRSGFAAATKEFIFYTDGDFQYDPADLPALMAEMKEGVDIVNGYKIKRHDPLHRIVIGRVYHYLMKLLFGFKIRDVDCDFRLMRRAIFDKVELKHDTGVICVEMVKKIQDAGFVFAEAPVHHFFRAYGKSQFFNFRRLLRVGVNILRLWWELVASPRGASARQRPAR
jgi:glycosyltransferase involved in cell wall biosynthesis